MGKLIRSNYIYLIALFIFLSIISIVNRNYMVNSLFFLCVVFSHFIVNQKDTYEKLYYTMIISAFFEYTAYFLKFEKIYLFHIFISVTALYFAYLLLKKKIVLQKIDKYIMSFYVFWYIYMLIGLMWSKNTSFTMKYIIIYTMMFAFLFIIIQFNNSKERFYNTLKVIGVMFVLSTCIGLLESMLGTQLPVKHYYNYTVHKLSLQELAVVSKRPIVFFYNSNNFATFATIFLSFGMFFTFYFKNKWFKVCSFIVTIIAFTAVILTNSRTNFVTAIVILLIYSILTLKEGGKKSLVFILLFVITFTVSYKYSYMLVSKKNVVSVPKTSERMKALTKINKVEIGEEGSENERMTIIMDVYEGIVKEGRYFGFGAGNTSQYLMDRKNTAGIYSPHGFLIELFGDFGIVFVLIFITYALYLLYNVFMVSIKTNGSNQAIGYSLLAAIIGYGLASFAPSSVTYFLPHWMFFGLIISYLEVNKNIRKGKIYEY